MDKKIKKIQPKIINFFCMMVVSIVVVTCNKDNPSEPYQPVALPGINRLDFICGNDSSIFIYDANMVLTSGRGNQNGNSAWKETFVMEYRNDLLTGATYEYVLAGRNDTRDVTYNRNDFNMLSKLTCSTWTKTLTFSYDDYRLTQIKITDARTENRYTIVYLGLNVISVELFRKSENGGETTTKTMYDDHDSNMNPFRYLVNVFHAPAFASAYGSIRYDLVPMGLLLSANIPGTAAQYVKNGDDWVETEGASNYHVSVENNRPVGISGGDLSIPLKIEYH